MAHEVEQMAYTGAVPWHGLGNSISEDSTIEEWQVQAGLDWEVSKRPVLFQAPIHYEDGSVSAKNVPFKDKFVLARTTDDRPFSVVSGRYKPVQPKQILEFFRDLVSRFGMKIETAGSLRDGQRVWALANTKEAHKVMGIDEIKGYLMLVTSYDLTFSTLAYFTSIRVVCNNTLQASFGDMVSTVKIPHVREFDIDAVHTELGVGKEQWEAFTKAMDTLAKIKLDAVKAEEVMGKVFQLTNDPVKDSVNKQHIAKVLDLFSGRAIGSDIAGQTGWGLVNATTEYLDYHKRARGNGNRLDSAWFGDAFHTKQRAVNETLLLAA